MHRDKSAVLWFGILNRCYIYIFIYLFILRCRKIGARATGVSAVTTVTVSYPWWPLWSLMDRGVLSFSSALTYHLPLTPGQAGISACTVLATRTQPSARRCTASITDSWNNHGNISSFASPCTPPLCAHNVKQGGPDSFCLKNLQTLLMTNEYLYGWLHFPFAVCLQE